VSDEVRAVAEQLRDQRRLGLEVSARQRPALSEARAARQDQRPMLRELQLVSPGEARSDDAAVHEEDRWAVAQAHDVHRGYRPHAHPRRRRAAMNMRFMMLMIPSVRERRGAPPRRV
jgi:hypothetical protein